MPNLLEEKDWKILIDRINDGKCTPFLGAGACYGVLPLGGEIAEAWAQESKYPFEDAADLVRVAQFVASENDHMTPKERIVKEFRKHGAPDFKDPMEPHRALAELPLPVYITTNYDDFMVKALQYRYRDAKRELCRWNEYVRGRGIFTGLGHPA
jgi:hypothetical protein